MTYNTYNSASSSAYDLRNTEKDSGTPELTPSASQQLVFERPVVATMQNMTFKENQKIYSAGEMPAGIYMIKSGAVKVYVQRRKARGRMASPEFLTKVLGPGDIFGYQAIMKNMPHGEFVETLKPTEVTLYSKESISVSFRGASLNGTTIGDSLMKQIVKDLERKEKDSELHYLASVQERIAYQLVLLAEKFGTTSERGIHIDLKLTRNELAQLAGTINESLSRHLTEMKAEGIIDLVGKEIIVKNKPALIEKSGNF